MSEMVKKIILMKPATTCNIHKWDKSLKAQDIVYDFRAQFCYREPKVGVKWCMSNFSKLVYCKVVI